MYRRWRAWGSAFKWFWLAIIIRGRSQHVRIRRGVDNVSVAILSPNDVQPVSDIFFNHVRLKAAMRKL